MLAVTAEAEDAASAVTPELAVLVYDTAKSAPTVGAVVEESVAPGIAEATAPPTADEKLPEETAAVIDVTASVEFPSFEIVNGTVHAVARTRRLPAPWACTGVRSATCAAATERIAVDAAAAMLVANDVFCAPESSSFVVPSGAPRTRLDETGRSWTTTWAPPLTSAGRLFRTLSAKVCGEKFCGSIFWSRLDVSTRTVAGGGRGAAGVTLMPAQVPLVL